MSSPFAKVIFSCAVSGRRRLSASLRVRRALNTLLSVGRVLSQLRIRSGKEPDVASRT